MDSSYADILILALIAGFIILRLRATLGKNSGIDPRDLFKKQEDRVKETVIRVAARETKPEASPLSMAAEDKAASAVSTAAKPGIEAIRTADATFTVSAFLSGAKTAFEWVFEAFAKGDKDKLKTLMADDVFALFSQEIDRQQAIPGRKSEATLVAILSQDITDAQQNGSRSRVSVRFVSEQVHLVRDAATGAIVEGNPSAIQRVQDNWVFERDTTSRSPNWKIIDT